MSNALPGKLSMSAVPGGNSQGYNDMMNLGKQLRDSCALPIEVTIDQRRMERAYDITVKYYVPQDEFDMVFKGKGGGRAPVKSDPGLSAAFDLVEEDRKKAQDELDGLKLKIRKIRDNIDNTRDALWNAEISNEAAARALELILDEVRSALGDPKNPNALPATKPIVMVAGVGMRNGNVISIADDGKLCLADQTHAPICVAGADIAAGESVELVNGMARPATRRARINVYDVGPQAPRAKMVQVAPEAPDVTRATAKPPSKDEIDIYKKITGQI